MLCTPLSNPQVINAAHQISTHAGANAHKLLELIENEGVQEIGDWLKDQALGLASNVPGIMDMIGNIPGMFEKGGISGKISPKNS